MSRGWVSIEKMIKAIIFDCFGVLTTDHWREFLHNVPTDVRQELHVLNSLLDSSQINRKEFFARATQVSRYSEQELEQAMAPVNSKNSKLINYINELRKQNYKIGVISNVGSNWIRETLLTTEEAHLFDEMILSYEVRMTKPDHRIFMLAAEKLAVEPDECVFIDDIKDYCEAARAVGMQAIVYDNFSQMRVELEQLLSQSE